MTKAESLQIFKKGGWFDKFLILSYFKDCNMAMSVEGLREDVELLVRKKENCESVWFSLLASYVYTKCLLA